MAVFTENNKKMKKEVLSEEARSVVRKADDEEARERARRAAMRKRMQEERANSGGNKPKRSSDGTGPKEGGNKSRVQKRTEEKYRESLLKKRRRNVLLVMAEMIVCLVLCIGAYVVNVFSSYGHDVINGDIYVESTAPTKGTKLVTTIVEETNAEGEVIGTREEVVEVEEVVESISGYRNILILGLDARSQFNFGDDEGANTDVMIIASINNDTGEIKLVSILRDTVLKMEEGSSLYSYSKANDQYAQSGIADTISMLNRNLGLDIQEYVLVNWYGVAVCVDQLGGLDDITIPNELSLLWFNTHLTTVCENTGIWGQQLTTPGTYHMNGVQVVAYCRIRQGVGNDIGRTSNQREVLGKLLEKAKTVAFNGDINTLVNVARTGLGNVRSNLSLTEIIVLASRVTDYTVVDSMSFPQHYYSSSVVGNYKVKYNIVDALVATDFEQEVKELHAFLFGDGNYHPSAFIQNISNQMKIDAAGN